MKRITILLLTFILTSFGCAGNNSAPNTNAAEGGKSAQYVPSPSPTAASNQNTSVNSAPLSDESAGDAADFTGTANITEKKNAGIKNVARMSAVRSARHANYDRVVFEFAGAEMPTYHLEYIDKPVQQCGSGNTVPFAGDGWLEVRFSDAQAHDGSGNVTIADRERSPNLPVVKDLKITCDFESEVTWVLGVASPNKYRVIELKNPTRLAVDVIH